jgi:hypothetical protein
MLAREEGYADASAPYLYVEIEQPDPALRESITHETDHPPILEGIVQRVTLLSLKA